MTQIGALVVAVAMVAAWIGGQVWSDRQEDDWRAHPTPVAENMQRLRSGQDPEMWPAQPYVVAHPNVVSSLAAAAVGVVGTIVLLLLVIAAAVTPRR